MHFTGVVGTSAWAGVYVTQVCFYTNVRICEHTRCRLCTYVYMYICVYMHAYAYGCVCVSREIMLFIGKPMGRSIMISMCVYDIA